MDNTKYDILKDEIRDLRLNLKDYVKRDDLDYRNLQETTNKNTKDISKIQTQLESLSLSVEKGNNLTEAVNIQNIKIGATLENIDFRITSFNENIGKLEETVGVINVENSKNTENRLTYKQVGVAVAIAVIGAVIGGIAATPVP